jgi:hypothetical protein
MRQWVSSLRYIGSTVPKSHFITAHDWSSLQTFISKCFLKLNAHATCGLFVWEPLAAFWTHMYENANKQAITYKINWPLLLHNVQTHLSFMERLLVSFFFDRSRVLPGPARQTISNSFRLIDYTFYWPSFLPMIKTLDLKTLRLRFYEHSNAK